MVEHFESVMRLENFIFFVANLVIRNKVDLIINLVKKICNLFDRFWSEIIVTVKEKQILALGVLYSKFLVAESPSFSLEKILIKSYFYCTQDKYPSCCPESRR